MHDPHTVAFEIHSLIKHKSKLFPEGYRDVFITVWHIDPETDGSDDSCGWTWPPLSEAETNYANLLIDNDNDNLRSYFPNEDDRFEMKRKMRRIFRLHKHVTRRWWQHPRWHFWHWKIQIEPVLDLKRWLFSRCAKCGGRFGWGYAPTTTQWESGGPRWFRGECDVYHHECLALNAKMAE